MTKWRWGGLVCIAAVAGVACSAPGGGTQGSQREQGDDSVAEQAEALSTTEHCDTAAPQRTIAHNGSFATTTSYGSSQCAYAYLFDVTSYVPTGPGDGGLWPQPSYTFWGGSPPPSDKATCEASDVRSYVWDTTSTPSVFVGAKINRGSWNGACFFSGAIVPATGALVQGHKYRIAVSARLYNAAGTSFALKQAFLQVL